jgi:hypothetical protein
MGAGTLLRAQRACHTVITELGLSVSLLNTLKTDVY